MPSKIDPLTSSDDIPEAKTKFRDTLTVIRSELEHGGFYRAAAPGSVERLTRDRLADWSSVKDFGAIGDGIERPISQHPCWSRYFGPTKEALGISGVHKFDDIDEQDTVDGLAFLLALKALVRRGGGVLLVPTGHYIICRPFLLPSYVTVRGEGAEASIIENTFNKGTTEWETQHRTAVFFAGLHHPVSFGTNQLGAAHYPLVGGKPVQGGSQIVTLANATHATHFASGSQIFVRSFGDKYQYTGNVSGIPTRAFPNRVVAVNGTDLLLEYPIKDDLPLNAVKLTLLGTNFAGGTYENVPKSLGHHFSVDSAIEDLQLRGGYKVTGENGWYRGRMSRCKLVSKNYGITHNCCFRTVFEDLEMTVAGSRAFEIKGASHDNVYRRIRVLHTATVAQTDPILSIGESSENILLEDVVICESRFADADKVFVRAADVTFDNFKLTSERDSTLANSGTMMQICNFAPYQVATGRPPVVRLRNVDLEARRNGTSSTNGRIVRWLWVQGAADDIGSPLVEIAGLRCRGEVAGDPPVQRLWIFRPAAVTMAEVNIDADWAIDPRFAAQISMLAGTIAVPLADMRNARHWVNSWYRRRGKAILATDPPGDMLYWPMGGNATDPWQKADGARVTPS